jgi:hypothetical protein
MLKPSSVDENVALTRGYNMAFGVLSQKVLEILSTDIYETLLRNALPKGKDTDDADTRKFAVRSIVQTLKTIGMHNVSPQLLKDFMETFYRCLNDY